MKVEELKEKARNHEQREEWQAALNLYQAALRKRGQDEAPDISLYNRVGDIQTRLGQIDAAVEHYEKAIDLYVEAELPNNAIAICKKVLRNFPERNAFLLRMGQIRAGQGFLTDARHSFLTFAERATGLGDTESALNALVEFVHLSPEDVEIRQSLAAQLESHDRIEEAVEQYTEAYRLLLLEDRESEAETVSRRLDELAQSLPAPDLDAVRAEAAGEGAEELVLESTSLDDLASGGWVEDHDATREADRLEVPDLLDAAFESEPGEATSPDEGDWGEGSLAATAADAEVEFLPEEDEGIEDELEPLPILDLEDGVGAEEMEEEGEGFGPLPFLDLEEETPGDVEPQPVLDLEGEPTEDDAAWLSVPPDKTEVSSHQVAAESGDLDLAMQMVGELIRSDPDNVDLHQRLVEYAFRKSDDAALIRAYLGLAGCLARTGAPAKANAVLQQVLALAPGHEMALEGIRELEGAARSLPPVEVASSQEYVDLGSMVLGEEGQETTRWTVAADAPSGDDQADFVKMLSQFKEKVSEHLAVDDVAAHHDLGTAYMEMGLLDEAVAEFQMALRASPGHLPTHEVMGRCWLEMEKPDMAVRALNRALGVPCEVEDELIGIYYLMGRAKEKLGYAAEALEFYEKVFSLDINFEDVTERLRGLR
jgi:tetratricopeptide (TPR) repeat protein